MVTLPWKRRGARPSTSAADEREALVADLIRNGLLVQKLKLSPRAKEILAVDPQTCGDYYWSAEYVGARKAAALVHGTSVSRAAIG